MDIGTKIFGLHGYGAGFESGSDSDTGSAPLCSSLAVLKNKILHLRKEWALCESRVNVDSHIDRGP